MATSLSTEQSGGALEGCQAQAQAQAQALEGCQAQGGALEGCQAQGGALEGCQAQGGALEGCQAQHCNKFTEVKRAEAEGNLSNSTLLYLVSRLSGFTEIQIYRDHLLKLTN